MRYVPAASWRRLAWRIPGAISRPVDEVWLHHGAAGASTLATLRSYETFHVRTLGWAAPGYSWAVTEDGTIYELRGWWRQGAHTQGRNAQSYAICLVGDWTSRTPPQRMVEAVATIIRHGVSVGALSRAVLTGGHRDAPGASTACPGSGGMRAIPAVRRLLSGAPDPKPKPAPTPDPDEEWFMSLSKQEQDDIRAFARALRAGDSPVSGHQAGTDLRRSTLGRRKVDGNPEADAEFLSTLRRDIGGRPTTLVHLANFYRRIAERTGLAGNNSTGNANRVQLRD